MTSAPPGTVVKQKNAPARAGSAARGIKTRLWGRPGYPPSREGRTGEYVGSRRADWGCIPDDLSVRLLYGRRGDESRGLRGSPPKKPIRHVKRMFYIRLKGHDHPGAAPSRCREGRSSPVAPGTAVAHTDARRTPGAAPYRAVVIRGNMDRGIQAVRKVVG